jgi:hypothetical protein
MQLALEEFGDAAGLAVQFVSVVHQHRRRWMMRFATLSVVGMFLVLVLTFAMWPKDANFGGPGKTVAQDNSDVLGVAGDIGRQTKDKPKSPDEKRKPTVYALKRAQNQRIASALNEPTELDFTDQEFRQVISEIQDKHNIPIFIDQSAIDAGLSPEDSVTINMSGVSLGSALTLFLHGFDCTFIVKNEFLIIATKDSCPYVVRTFNCREIFEHLQPTGTGSGLLGNTAGADLLGGNKLSAGGTDSILRGLLGGEDFVADPRVQTRIMQLIQKMVSPESWEEGLEQAGALEFAGAVLFVRQQGPEIEQIGQVLDDLLNELEQQRSSIDLKPNVQKSDSGSDVLVSPIYKDNVPVDETEKTRKKSRAKDKQIRN